MGQIGKFTCLARGIWARRPWNPLGKQAVWYDHDFERINERDVFGIKWYDARCRRCGLVETGWRDALPLPGQAAAAARAQEAQRPEAKLGAKPAKPTKPPKPAKSPVKSAPKMKLKR